MQWCVRRGTVIETSTSYILTLSSINSVFTVTMDFHSNHWETADNNGPCRGFLSLPLLHRKQTFYLWFYFAIYHKELILRNISQFHFNGLTWKCAEIPHRNYGWDTFEIKIPSNKIFVIDSLILRHKEIYNTSYKIMATIILVMECLWICLHGRAKTHIKLLCTIVSWKQLFKNSIPIRIYSMDSF